MDHNTESGLGTVDHDLLIEINAKVSDLVDVVKGSSSSPGLAQRMGSVERWRSYITGAVAVLCGLWLASITIGGVLLASALQRK